jgi:hypothetical protein
MNSKQHNPSQHDVKISGPYLHSGITATPGGMATWQGFTAKENSRFSKFLLPFPIVF